MLYPFKIYFVRFTVIKQLKRYSRKTVTNLNEILLSMPKNRKDLVDLQNQRLKNKDKMQKYVPGKVTLQVLGTGAKGAPRSLYVFSDQTRYLFNCGEGTQRLAHELKLKLARLEHIFVTQPVWKNFGGLPGVSLTMQDVGVPSLTMHGPSGLKEMFEAAKKFVVLKNLKIRIADCNPDILFEDNVLQIKYVPLNRHLELSADSKSGASTSSMSVQEKFVNIGINVDIKMDQASLNSSKKSRKRSRSINSYINSDSAGSGKKRKRKNKKKRSRSLSNSLDDSNSSSEDDSNNPFYVTKDKCISMAYIVRLQPRPGPLNLERCVKKGVPPGPLLGKLKAGENVTLADGTLVKSVDVCEPDDPGPVFIVVDCPTEEYITSLVTNQEFKKHQKFSKKEEDICSVVVHFSSAKVVQDPRYQAWMNQFAPSTQHVMLNENNSCMGSASVHRIQHKLNLIHANIFPLLGDQGTEIIDENSLTKNSVKTDCESNIKAKTLTQIHLRPKKGIDRTEEIKLLPNEYVKETMEIEGFPNILHELKVSLSKKVNVNLRDYPRILFLGTGSCIPNKTRNTSGILLELGPKENILLDCGEGTYGQIVRFFGKENCDEVLANINAIYISHLHADHHIGVVGVLQGRRSALNNLGLDKRPISLFGPLQIYPWLTFYDRYFERFKEDFKFISNADILFTERKLEDSEYSNMLKELNLKSIETCYVRHCPNAFGVSMLLPDSSRITYSGDTMPCNDLVMLGKNSDLLIHEATMEDELEHEALTKLHSTTSQAIDIGKKMNAKNIILTHFSQRYAKLPRFNENFSDNVGIAFDNMMVKMDELFLLPTFHPALKMMFADQYEELEQKAVKRQLRQEHAREEKQKLIKRE